jgi:Tfp pilus assembly protein PilO
MNIRIFPIITLVIAVILFFVYINPTWTGSIASTRAAITSDNQTLAAVSAYTSEESQLTSARNAINQDSLAKLSAFLPDSVDNVGIILDLNALAARSGLSLSNIDVMPNAASAPANGVLPTAGTSAISSVDISLSALGTYAAFQNFLTGIEKSERLLDARNITVKGSDTGVYSYQMTLRIYWLQ